MSVVCWKHQGKYSPVIAWRIGNMKHFDNDGHYVFAQHRLTAPKNEHQSPRLNQLSLLSQLAALTHDIGKSTLGFDLKLRKNEGAARGKGYPDPVRHELLSLLMLMPMARKIEEAGRWSVFTDHNDVASFFDTTVREALAQQCIGYREVLEETSKEHAHPYSMLIGRSVSGFDLSKLESQPLLTGWLWLVLTHHKLPANDIRDRDLNSKAGRGRRGSKIAKTRAREGISSIRIKTTLWRYVNYHPEVDCEPFFALADCDPGVPWKSPPWTQRLLDLLSEMDKANYCFDTVDLKKSNPYVSGLLHYARPSLIMADHLASSQKAVTEQHQPGCYANTAEQDGVICMADLLDDHLLKTEDWSGRIFHQLFCEQGGERALPRIPQSDTQQLLDNTAPGDYHWQNTLAELGNQVDPEGGLLALVTAGTGSGKTRGCIKLLNECAPEAGLRASLALGLRSLADQGYRDYIQYPISLPKESVGRLIGAYYPIEPQEESLGTSASVSDGDVLLSEEGALCEGDAFIDMVMNGANSTLLPKPVTTLTIDNLIDVISLHRPKASYLVYHLLHTDLIIDEIDNLGAEDLIFVEILVYLTGLYGRKCIIASATLNPVIAKAMGEAYKKGFAEHQALYGDKPGTMAVVSNEAPYHISAPFEDNPSGDGLLSSLAGEWDTKENERHRTAIVPLKETTVDIDSLCVQIRECVLSLSANHVVQDPSGMGISQGFVRFNRVDEAQRFAMTLAQMGGDDDCYVEVICYHAKTTGFERYHHEYHLNHLMKRGEDGLPKGCPRDVEAARQAFLDRARAAGATRATLVVSTTSIIEVGRDHDYDWCILEPTSLASYLQSIGRVLRHRKSARVSAATPNILVLESPSSVLRKQANLWAFPGIESPSPLQSSKRPCYQLTLDGSADIAGRLDDLGIKHGQPSETRVELAADMLGASIMNPSNQLMARMPENYQDLPEYSLALTKLADHLCANHNPINSADFAGINAGNILQADKYRFEHKLGRDLRFRGADNTEELVCDTDDGDYSRGWQRVRHNSRGHEIDPNS